MNPTAATEAPPPAVPFTPVAQSQRIEALDVVRGFALLGIFLMNIEWFNRPVAAMGEGMPRDLTGLNWLASWFVAYFVQGKFWTIFSLLFGMGFAVMLVRAERAGRPFLKVYLRRILALAVFGAVHFIYLWDGDILFSYSVGALGLLIVLYGKARPILIALAVLVGLGFIPDANAFFGVAGGLAIAGLLALYLRSEKRLRLRGLALPLFSFILMLVGLLVSVGAAVFWLLPNGPIEPRLPMSVFGPLLVLTGWLSWKYHEPVEKRSLRMAVAVYVFFGAAMTIGSTVQHFAPDPTVLTDADRKADAALLAARAQAAAQARPAASAPSAAAASAAASAAAADKPKKTKAERAEEIKAERAKRLKEGAERKADEIKTFTTGTYRDGVEWRARRFIDKAAGDAGFGVVLVAMFLLGAAFVRSGVMDDTERHLPLFRKLAVWGLSTGIGVGLLTSFFVMSHTPGDRYDGWGITRGLMTLGNLPACLGYVGLVVLMLHSQGPFSRIRVLAPMGRMALTNYLTQSVICSFIFFHHGLGLYGIPRAQQVLFVLVVYAAQVAFSHWWLARFQYGPMEWLWRGFTYRQVPPMRLAPAAPPAATSAA